MRVNFENARSIEQFTTGKISVKIYIFLFFQSILVFYAHSKDQTVVY